MRLRNSPARLAAGSWTYGRAAAVLCGLLCASSAWAQNSQNSQGSFGALSRGAGRIGQRAARDVAIRFYADASGIYDTGLTPVSASGTSVAQEGGLYGVEAGLGVYGKREFQRGQLGIDYKGSYRHYTSNTFFSGANQDLTVGYTWQKSRRIIFDFSQSAGSSAYANALTFGLPPANDSVIDSTSLLFDNRTNYMRTNVDMTYMASQRTSFTMGGNWNGVSRQSKALIGVRGYGLRGNIEHQLNARSSVGVSYDHSHYDFPGSHGGSDIDTFSGTYSRQIGRSWTTSLTAGFYRSQVEGLTQVAVEPVIAILLGINFVTQPFYRVNVAPYGKAELVRQFRNASWSVSYQRYVTPGNGVYLTSKQQNAASTFSYLGVRRWTFSVNAGYGSLSSLGTALPPYSQYYAGADLGFAIMDSLHITAGFSGRHQDIELSSFRRDATRTSLSIAFSPGSVPLSLRR